MAEGASEPPPVNVHVSLHNVSDEGALTISNGETADIVMSSGVAVAQLPPSQLYALGSSVAGTGLEALAEDGAPDAFYEEMAGDPEARPIVLKFSAPYGAGENGDLLDPGNTAVIDFTAPPDTRFAFAMMFVQSNDVIVATVPEGIALGDEAGERDITDRIVLVDVGTEMGEEPGLGPSQAPRQPAPGAGIDENGTVMVIEGTDAQGHAYPEVSSFLSATLRIDTEPPID